MELAFTILLWIVIAFWVLSNLWMGLYTHYLKVGMRKPQTFEEILHAQLMIVGWVGLNLISIIAISAVTVAKLLVTAN